MSIRTWLTTASATMVERVLPSVVQVVNGGRGAGAGVIWRDDGAILTNHHVVARQERVDVRLTDGQELVAKVVNRQPALDLALLQVKADQLPAALVDDATTIRVGELVFAIGHPWGQPNIVTAGIVSGLGSMPLAHHDQQVPYIRSDVRLAPGNSGGPLLNARGAVVGINAMIFGGDQSVSILSQAASQWIAGLPSRRVSLGIEVQTIELPPTFRQGAWSQRAAGLLVTDVSTQNASRSELLVGDVLLDAAGSPISNVENLSQILGHYQAHERVPFHLMRGGVMQKLDITVSSLEHRL